MVTTGARTYARIADNTVMELLKTSGDIRQMFHSNLQWIDVTDVVGIAYGWSYDGKRFAPPA